MSKALQKSALFLLAISIGLSLRAQQSTAPFGTSNGQPAVAPTPAKPTQLDALKADYQRQVQLVVKPIQDKYVAALQTLMTTLTQNQSLDQALAVQRELKLTQAQPAPSYLSQIGDSTPPVSGLRSQLDNLRYKYSADLRTVIKPIQDRYVQVLTNLLATSSRSGDLDLAVAARDELKIASAAPAVAEPALTASGGVGTAQAPNAADANAPGPGWYYVQSQVSELYLTVFKARHIAGTHIDQEKKQGEQVWKFIPDSHGNYFIQSKIGQLFLDSKPTADDWMDEVEQTPDLVWKLIPDGNGNYFIQSVATGKNLDVSNAYKDIGNKIHLAPQDTKQVWKLIKMGGDEL